MPLVSPVQQVKACLANIISATGLMLQDTVLLCGFLISFFYLVCQI